MKLELYALHDDKLSEFNQPVVGRSDAAMIRNFGDLIHKDHESIIGMHPADFSLWYLGTFDDITGEFHTDVKNQRCLARGSDFSTSASVPSETDTEK